MKSIANETQIGGTHYKDGAMGCPHCGEQIEHWDLAWGFRWNNFVYAITKYLMRKKGGIEDIDKAMHCLEKYKECLLADARANKEPDMDIRPGEWIMVPPGVDPETARRVLLAGRLENPLEDIGPIANLECECLGSYCRLTAEQGTPLPAGTHCKQDNERKRYTCPMDLCPGHHLAMTANCDTDPPGPGSSVRPG